MAASKINTAWRVIGQTALRQQLAEALRQDRAAHAFLFTGPRGVGKVAVALEFAALLLCDNSALKFCGNCPQCNGSVRLQHPDLHVIFPLPPRKTDDKEEREFSAVMAQQVQALAADLYAPSWPPKAKEIRIGLVQYLMHLISMKAYQSQRRVCAILHADAMNDNAQNALLKVLEEPPPGAFFLLTAENTGELLPTIRSRCQTVRMAPLEPAEIAAALVEEHVDPERAALAASLAGGSFARARELSGGDLEVMKNRVVEFLRSAALCDPVELPAVVAAMNEDSKLPEGTPLEMLGLFLRDVALHRTHATSGGPRVFSGFEDSISRLLVSYPQADLDAAVRAVDQSADYLSRGYTQDYVFYSLAIRLHEALGARAAARPKSGATPKHA